jgi:hypothetical protein
LQDTSRQGHRTREGLAGSGCAARRRHLETNSREGFQTKNDNRAAFARITLTVLSERLVFDAGRTSCDRAFRANIPANRAAVFGLKKTDTIVDPRDLSNN